MFSFESLELLYWDYWERVQIPFDERIIAVVGPNGSGKTTLLDALRTLLGIKPSQKRDYKKYARRLNKPHSWVVATVKNRKDKTNRPCFFPIYNDKVTLACRIEKKGGEWQRAYFIRPGVVPLEELLSSGLQDVLRLREYQSVLEKAGLSGAMLRVLSLEQGATDKLCEYSPKEMLSLVYDAFGDKATLDNYEKAMHEQLEARRELEELKFKVEKLENQLSNLTNKVNNHLEYQGLIKRKIYMETEVKAQALYVQLMDNIEGVRRNITGLKKEIQLREEGISMLAEKLAVLEAEEERSGKYKEEVDRKIRELQTRLIEENTKRASVETQIKEIQRLAALAEGVEPEDSSLLQEKLEDEIKNQGRIEDEIEKLEQSISENKKQMGLLKAGTLRPVEGAVEEFSMLLKSANITHTFLYEGVEVVEDKWRLAIESILRGYKYIIVLEDSAQRWRAWEMGEKVGYRHFIVSDIGNTGIPVPTGSALEAVKLKDFVPEWIRRQLADIHLVDTVNDGKRLPDNSTFVTMKGFMREKRGGRSIAVPEGDFVFGAAGRKRQIEFLQKRVDTCREQMKECEGKLSQAEKQIHEIRKKTEKQEALRNYLLRKDDELKLSVERRAINESIEAIEKEAESLYVKQKVTEKAYQDTRESLVLSRKDFKRLKTEFNSRWDECKSLRRELLNKIKEIRKHRSIMPPSWKTAEKLSYYRDKFGDVKNVDREIEDIEKRIEEGQWEKDPKVIDLKAKVEKDYAYEFDNVNKKEREFAETVRVTGDARAAYIDILRASIRFYEKNLKALAELAGIEVEVIKPRLENDDAILNEAGIEIKWNFDGKGFISTDDGEASGGQQVIKSLILLVALMMNEGTKGGFIFIDEPFAHLDVFNIDKVSEFLLRTETQFIITSPNTHNTNIYRPAMLSIFTKKKTPSEPFAPPPMHIRRHNA